MSHLLCSNPRLLYTHLGVEMSYVGMKVRKEISPPDWGGTKQNQPGISLSAWAMENTLTMLRSSYEVSGFQQPYKIKGILKKSWKLRHFITKFSAECEEGGNERQRERERERERESTYTNITGTHSGVKEKTGSTGFSHFYQFADHLW